jgi:hypothetical protein
MTNKDAGKNAFPIPIGPGNRSSSSSSAVAAKAAKIISQAHATTKAADFTPAARQSSSRKPRAAGSLPRRRRGSDRVTRLKGIYFEPEVYDALVHMQQEGQNASMVVNKIVKEKLGL